MKERYMLIPPGDTTELQPFEVDMATAYKIAFAGEPWYEKTKCAGALLLCPGGLSPLEKGIACLRCGETPTEDAYDEGELIEKWRNMGGARPTAWYLELVDEKVALAGFFWQATAEVLAREKYPDVPAMEPWLRDRFGTEPLIWLDEMFANKAVRSCANLARFGAVMAAVREEFGTDRIAYRTITPQMKRAAEKLGATPLKAFVDVPDRRDFITIEGGS